MNFLTTLTNYTDPQGQLHTNPVFGIDKANEYVSISTSISSNVDIDNTSVPIFDPITVENVNSNINVRFMYWISQAAKDEGRPVYWIVNGLKTSFDFDSSGPEYAGMTTQEKCFYYLENVVLAE
jgi:hypothetical protein